MFSKAHKKIAAITKDIPSVSPLLGTTVRREAARVADNIAEGPASVTVDAVKHAVKQSTKNASSIVGEITGSRRKTNQRVDEQNDSRRKQVMEYLNSRGDADIQDLEQKLSDMFAAYGQQESFDPTEMKAIYKQWRIAVIELETDQELHASLDAVLEGDQALLKNFLMESEFRGDHNPLTLAAERFFTSNLNSQTITTLVNRAFDRLSDNSELFYLEQDANGDTMAELLLQTLEPVPPNWSPEQELAHEEIVNKLLTQALKDACIALDRQEEDTLQRLIVLGRPLLDKFTMDGQALSEKMIAAGYQRLLADFQQAAPDAERQRLRM